LQNDGAASNFICRPIKRKMIVRIDGLRASLAREDKQKPPTAISSAALPAHTHTQICMSVRRAFVGRWIGQPGRSNIYPASALPFNFSFRIRISPSRV
jgi:hypothetical protein